MLRRATLLLLLLPGIALGQVGTVTALVTTQGTTGQANRAECAATGSVATWNIVSTGITLSAGDKWRLATSQGSCSTTVPTTFLVDALATSATQAVTGVFVQQMGSEGSVSCTGANDQQINLCVYYLPGGTAPTNPVVLVGTFNFQTAIPPAPSITGVSPGDSQLSVAVVGGTTTATETATTGVTFTVACAPPGGGAVVNGGPGNAGNIVCAGLTNNVAYTVTATGQSAAGNTGATSAPVGPSTSTTPLPFVDFWNNYKSAGGVEQGGCGTGGAGAMAPALALLAVLAARRRRS